MKKGRLIILLLVLACTLSVFAQESQDAETPQSEEEIVFDQPPAQPDGAAEAEPIGTLSVWSFVSMVLVLVGVVAAIYGLFYLLKRMSGQNFADNNLIRVVSTKTLSSTRSVHLVTLGKRYLLLGSAENAVNLIAEIDDKESRDEIDVFLARDEGSPRKSFKELFGGIFSGGGGKLDETLSSSAVFLKGQGDRVKKL